jgi:hypothetical protein
MVLAAVIVLDVALRFFVGFQMRGVAAVEAVLFAAASVLLLWADRRNRPAASARKRLDFWLAIFFALGSLRAGLWAAGVRVSVANLVILAVGVLTVIGYALRQWVHHRSGWA